MLKPGITGWAQVNGWRGPTDTEEQRKQRTLHDLWYVENWSLALDFKIVFLTLFSKKAHQACLLNLIESGKYCIISILILSHFLFIWLQFCTLTGRINPC
jgi:hypothetical protein